MRTVRTHLDLTADDRPGAVAAIGNFDGVHLGHQAVINTARAAAHAASAPLSIVTFEPHPRQVFAPDAPPFRLMNAAAKANRLDKLGIDILYEIPFSKDLAALTPDAFVHQVLSAGLGLSHVVVGADFCFGKDRAGSVEDLLRLGPQLGFQTTVQPLMAFQGLDVSSTRIRQALADGRPQDAALMLGHHHRIEGEVIKGDQRGRDLGYPTANLALDGLAPPRFGVYAVSVDVLTGAHRGRYAGVASLGVRPMFGVNTPNFETHIFDFKGDLYGADISVALVEFLRDEARFDSVEALITQMDADSAAAKKHLTGLT
ncbi:MAG: bifunctional riboflavin kinase/FAD synthetase [Pseudomonadota bacterium]